MTYPRTSADIFDAFENMLEQTKRKLLGVSRFYSRGTRFDPPIDLLHEALLRTVNGRRAWGQNIDFAVHLVLAMRSIADADRQSHANRLRDDLVFDELLEWGVDLETCHVSAEEECIKIQEQHALRAAASRASAQWTVSGDEEARAVLDAMLEDFDSREIAERLGLGDEAVRLAKRRVLRKLVKLTRLVA